MSESPRLAAVDCGTNSLRLLIGERDASGVDGSASTAGWRALRRETRIVGLGQGVDQTGRLAPEAVARALGALAEYTRLLQEAEVSRVAMVATSASRDAHDAQAFLEQARAVLRLGVSDVDVRVISGAEEARLSLFGATSGLDSASTAGGRAAPGPYVVVDVGGGSTELAVGSGEALSGAVSLDVGCVRLTERFVRCDPPAPEELAQARELTRGLLRSAALPELDSVRTAVAVAGTAATVAAVALGHAALDEQALRGARVSMAQVEATAQLLSSMTLAERLALGPMHPGRASVIPAGAWVLAEVGRYLQERVGVTEFLVREEDILDGVLLSLVSADE